VVNVNTLELDESFDEAGFRNLAATIGPRLGARRIGAGLYEAEAGFPIWPYHYHHGIEEWLYVIAGAPVLREPAGERNLTPGDLVRFPTGPVGAHTVKGPGRFVIFSAGQDREPWMSVYPDSDKVSGPEGILLLDSRVGYFHNEGTSGPREPDEIVRSRETPPLLEATVVEDGSEPHLRLRAREMDAGPGRNADLATSGGRVGLPRAAVLDHGPARQRLPPGHRRLGDPERRRDYQSPSPT
jgi:uncharacterized cupin superfamily protein